MTRVRIAPNSTLSDCQFLSGSKTSRFRPCHVSNRPTASIAENQAAYNVHGTWYDPDHVDPKKTSANRTNCVARAKKTGLRVTCRASFTSVSQRETVSNNEVHEHRKHEYFVMYCHGGCSFKMKIPGGPCCRSKAACTRAIRIHTCMLWSKKRGQCIFLLVSFKCLEQI